MVVTVCVFVSMCKTILSYIKSINQCKDDKSRVKDANERVDIYGFVYAVL